jgi:hypothetical protein
MIGWPVQYRKKRIGRKGQLGRDRQNRKDRTGRTEQEGQNRKDRTGQAEQGRQKGTGREGKKEHTGRGKNRTGQAEQDFLLYCFEYNIFYDGFFPRQICLVNMYGLRTYRLMTYFSATHSLCDVPLSSCNLYFMVLLYNH